MKTNSSNYIDNRVSSQISKDRILHSIAVFSKNLNLTKYNYEIYNKELWVIIKYFKQ